MSESRTKSRYWKPIKVVKKINAARTTLDLDVVEKRLTYYIQSLQFEYQHEQEIKAFMLVVEKKFEKQNKVLLDSVKSEKREEMRAPSERLGALKILAEKYRNLYDSYPEKHKNALLQFHDEDFSDSDPETHIPSNMTHEDFLNGIIPKKRRWDNKFLKWGGMIKAKHEDGFFFLSNRAIFTDLVDSVTSDGDNTPQNSTILNFVYSGKNKIINTVLLSECMAAMRQFRLNEGQEILHDLFEYNKHEKYIPRVLVVQNNFENLIRTETFLRLYHSEPLDYKQIRFFQYIVGKFEKGQGVNIAEFTKLHFTDQWVINNKDEILKLQEKCKDYMSRVMPKTIEEFHEQVDGMQALFDKDYWCIICTKWTTDDERSQLIKEKLLDFHCDTRTKPKNITFNILSGTDFLKFKIYFNATQVEHLTRTEEDFVSNLIKDAVSIKNLVLFYHK